MLVALLYIFKTHSKNIRTSQIIWKEKKGLSTKIFGNFIKFKYLQTVQPKRKKFKKIPTFGYGGHFTCEPNGVITFSFG